MEDYRRFSRVSLSRIPVSSGEAGCRFVSCWPQGLTTNRAGQASRSGSPSLTPQHVGLPESRGYPDSSKPGGFMLVLCSLKISAGVWPTTTCVPDVMRRRWKRGAWFTHTRTSRQRTACLGAAIAGETAFCCFAVTKRYGDG